MKFDLADDPQYWTFKLPPCSDETTRQVSNIITAEWIERDRQFRIARIDDMNAVDADIGCHLAIRSGYYTEPRVGEIYVTQWPNYWPYKYPPCSADGKPVADVRPMVVD